jgi:amino acid transporter
MQTPSSPASKRVLSVFSLVMINVIAVDSIRTLPVAASYGLSLVFLYLIGSAIFFIPTALITAELATTWPEKGGIYTWVKEAFGPQWGFLVVYLQWIYNIVWYPTILTLTAATLAYLIDPDLTTNRWLMLSMILVIFWGCTLLNCFGMRLSSLISTVGSLIGTLFPMLFIISLASTWLIMGNPSQIEFSVQQLVPQIHSLPQLVFFTAILYSLLGLEMSSVHALEVKNPARDYPRALLISAVIIFFSLCCASLAIAVVVPQAKLDIVTGIIQAFSLFFTHFGLQSLTPYIAGAIIIGGICGVATWIIGPTKGLFAAASDGLLPKGLDYTNRYGAPVKILLLQGLIGTTLSGVYLLLPTVQSAYWLLSAMTAQLSFLMYALLFAATIRLRYVAPQKVRPFKIWGGNWGVWLVAGTGFLASIGVILLGFIPPTEVEVSNIWQYETILILGGTVIVGPAFIWPKYQALKQPKN